MSKPAINYTEQDVLKLHDLYDGSTDSVELLVQVLEKSKRSVIGKLAKEGIYKKTGYITKTGDAPVTKKEMVHDIATVLEMDYEELVGLEKSPKAGLKNLQRGLELMLGNS